MKNLILFTLLASAFIPPTFGDDKVLPPPGNPYSNFREAKSQLIDQQSEDELSRKYEGTSDLMKLNSIMANPAVNRCASKILGGFRNELGLKDQRDLEEAILALRLQDSLDDMAAGILIKFSKIDSLISHPIAHNDLTAEQEKKALTIFQKEAEALKSNEACREDSYRSLVSKLLSESIKFKKNLKRINKLALEKELITPAIFKEIERFRSHKVHEWPKTLSTYANNLDSLAKRFPDRKKESAAIITNGGKIRFKASLRQSLHERFNSTQIVLLSNVVRDLKKRFESKDINIHINYVEQESEIISLSPMEKFRFILKLLRKELALLNNGTLLGGQQTTYMDVITASYEVGYISAAEIEQLASLEDIWNPKKTTKEKVMFWVKTFGGVASVLLPPPFGFVSVMAIMLIDQQITEAPVDPDADFNLL